MLAPPPKISKAVTRSGVAKDRRPDAALLSLAAKVTDSLTQLPALDEDEQAWSDALTSHGRASATISPGMAEFAADLDRLEKKIAKSRATTIEGLKAKAEAANKLRRFGYESISDSIIRDLITNDSVLASAGCDPVTPEPDRDSRAGHARRLSLP